jgi:hypothetical protein
MVMGRVVRWIGALLLLLVVVAGTLYARRTNPIGPIAGRQLAGEVVAEPVSDWSFAKDERTIAIETRPASPYSVTTWSFVYEGQLYVPASAGSTKSWTHYAAADPRVRVKIGDKIYPGIATRVTDASLREPLREVARTKYDLAQFGNAGPSDVWLFRIESPRDAVADPDVAAGQR